MNHLGLTRNKDQWDFFSHKHLVSSQKNLFKNSAHANVSIGNEVWNIDKHSNIAGYLC